MLKQIIVGAVLTAFGQVGFANAQESQMEKRHPLQAQRVVCEGDYVCIAEPEPSAVATAFVAARGSASERTRTVPLVEPR